MIRKLPGVEEARLNFAAAKLTVTGDVSEEALAEECRKDGVTLRPAQRGAAPQTGSFWESYGKVVLAVLSGLLALSGWLLEEAWGEGALVLGLFTLAILTGGWGNFRKAYHALQRLQLDMSVLMSVAVVGAVLIGEWTEGAWVAFLYAVSEALEGYSMDKARHSIRSLMELTPQTASVVRGGGEEIVPVEELAPGDVLVVRPGEKIPLDGVVAEGRSTVNQAPITGESVPVDKGEGDEVFAGTLNQVGLLRIRVTRLVEDTAIAKVIHLVEEAQARRAPAQAFVDRFARYYTPAVIVLALAVSALPPLLGLRGWHEAVYQGLSLLVVACPCALVVSTPVAILSAIGSAARHGVLIKGGAYLETLGQVDALAFDKTGTLTHGHPEVTDVIPAGTLGEMEVLCLAASLENLSEHPLARAVVRHAKARGLPLMPVKDFQAQLGLGVTGKLGGAPYLLGNPRMMEELGVDLAPVRELVESLRDQGKTVMVLHGPGGVIGLIALADRIREGVAGVLASLKERGVAETVMLTGDHRTVAQEVARQAGVDRVFAELLPEGKVQALHELAARGRAVAMVGDGINDAPAFAASRVGIAMGAAGSDTALETADIVLMADDLEKLPYAVDLSRKALRIIKQNIYFSILIKAVAVFLVFPGWLTLWIAILADMGASLLVTANGTRLLAFRPKKG